MNTHNSMAERSDQDIRGRLAFLGIDQRSTADLQRLRPIIERELPKGLDRFYDTVRNTPETRRFFSSDEHMNRAKSAQIGHWGAIATGRFDQDYVNRVRTIGSVHARIGLQPRWYIGGYALLVEQLVQAILEEHWPKSGLLGRKQVSSGETAALLVSFFKAVMLDMDLSISVFIDEAEEAKKKAQQEAIAAERRMVVGAFGQAMARMADKDLTYRIEDDLPEAYTALADDFNNALAELASTINDIGGAARQIDSGSSEIRSAADDLSKRAEQQAAAVEETAAAVEQITSAVRSSTGRAEETGQLVEKTRKDAEHSGEVVRNAVDAMGRIAKSSEDISRIIGVIDDIAFQTNLLALNAGVEAARAGDAGKGFAVVAQEVRELAQRSANAAKEIKQLITTSSNEVKSGVAQVSETGKALETIVAAVREISTNVVSIIESAREQSGGLEEINTSIGSIDQGTQQNAAMSEELTASSYSLGREVESINAMLREFRTGRRFEATSSNASQEVVASRPSPARELGRKVVQAFAGNAAAEADDWEAF